MFANSTLLEMHFQNSALLSYLVSSEKIVFQNGMKNGLEVTSQIVDIWENAELMTKKIQVAKKKVRNRIPKWKTLVDNILNKSG